MPETFELTSKAFATLAQSTDPLIVRELAKLETSARWFAEGKIVSVELISEFFSDDFRTLAIELA